MTNISQTHVQGTCREPVHTGPSSLSSGCCRQSPKPPPLLAGSSCLRKTEQTQTSNRERERDEEVVPAVVLGCLKNCIIFFPFRHASVSVFIVYVITAVIDQQVIGHRSSRLPKGRLRVKHPDYTTPSWVTFGLFESPFTL